SVADQLVVDVTRGLEGRFYVLSKLLVADGPLHVRLHAVRGVDDPCLCCFRHGFLLSVRNAPHFVRLKPGRRAVFGRLPLSIRRKRRRGKAAPWGVLGLGSVEPSGRTRGLALGGDRRAPGACPPMLQGG